VMCLVVYSVSRIYVVCIVCMLYVCLRPRVGLCGYFGWYFPCILVVWGVLCLSYSLHPLGVDVRGSFPDGCDSVSFFCPTRMVVLLPLGLWGSWGSSPFLHGGLGVFLPTRLYGVGYSPGWVCSCYLCPIPFALRVFLRLVICMALDVWGGRGSPPPTYMEWVRSVFLTRMCYWT
jgi:hypothetical protein